MLCFGTVYTKNDFWKDRLLKKKEEKQKEKEINPAIISEFINRALAARGYISHPLECMVCP